MKRLIFAVFLLITPLAVSYAGTPTFKTGTNPLVDGVYNSTMVVITGRQPVFSWEYATYVGSFTIAVNDDTGAAVWNYIGSTTTVETINYIMRVPYNKDGAATALAAGKTYAWTVTIYDVADTSATSSFSTVSSAVTLPDTKLDLAIDWNNPFDPSKNQTTKFVFSSKNRDRKVQVRVFTLSGALVQYWGEQTILKDAWYTITWDGKNLDGDVVARGIYLVSLLDVGEGTGVTRKVAVVKDK